MDRMTWVRAAVRESLPLRRLAISRLPGRSFGRLQAMILCHALVVLVLPAIANAGGSVYVTTARGVSQYSIGASGLLTPKDSSDIFVGGAFDIAVSPNGRNAYVAAAGGLSQYDVDPRTGALSP